MRVVIQKVTQASVSIENQTVASIVRGLLVLVGIEDDDTNEDIAWLSAKIVNLRVFDDENGVMNLSVKEKCLSCRNLPCTLLLKKAIAPAI